MRKWAAAQLLDAGDEHTRECLAIDVSSSIRSERVIELLVKLITVHGAPTFIRSDNGPEFIAQALQEWMKDEGIENGVGCPSC